LHLCRESERCLSDPKSSVSQANAASEKKDALFLLLLERWKRVLTKMGSISGQMLCLSLNWFEIARIGKVSFRSLLFSWYFLSVFNAGLFKSRPFAHVGPQARGKTTKRDW